MIALAFFRDAIRLQEEEIQQREALNATMEKLLELKKKEKQERQARVDALKQAERQNER